MGGILGGIVSGIGGLIGGSQAASGAREAAETNAAAQRYAVDAALKQQQLAFEHLDEGWGRAQSVTDPWRAIGIPTGQRLYNMLQSGELGQNQALPNAFPNWTPMINIPTGGTVPVGGDLPTSLLGLSDLPDISDPSKLPGYQFTLDQGLKAVQNSAAAKGLGISGAALKGAADYTTGLTNSAYSNYLDNYWKSQQARFGQAKELFGQGQTRFQDITGLQQQQFLDTVANQQNYFKNWWDQGQASFGQGQTLFGDQQTIFGDQWANQNNRFNMLANLMNVGANASNQLTNVASQLGSAGGTVGTSTGSTIANAITGTAGNIGSAQMAAGNILGAGFTGAGRSIGNALTGAGLNGGNDWFSNLFSGGGSGWGSSGTGGLY